MQLQYINSEINFNNTTFDKSLILFQEFISLLFYLVSSASAQEFFRRPNNFAVKLTAERAGPPPGALFVPISVVNIPESGVRPSLRPLKGRPPPPPPLVFSKPTRRPKPTLGPVAPPALPVPVSVSQELPMGPESSQTVPPLPQGVTVVTPVTEINPELEVVSSTTEPPPTTTPNTNDASPAYYQRFTLNDDGSYFFE